MTNCLPQTDGILYLGTKTEPRVNKGKLYKLNAEFGLISDPTFEKAKIEDYPAECKDTYISYSDPRTIDPRRGEKYKFNRAPLQAMKTQMLNYDEIYGTAYSTKYSGYANVGLGQYLYYVDTDMSAPYRSPIYTLRSDVHTDAYNDPMGGRRVNFEKFPITGTYNNISDYQETRDQLSYREDMMARQQRKYNEQRYENFNT